MPPDPNSVQLVEKSLAGFPEQVPAEEARKLWLGERFRQRIRPLADRFRDQLVRTYGDFQDTYEEAEPDFFIHVAQKSASSTPLFHKRYRHTARLKKA